MALLPELINWSDFTAGIRAFEFLKNIGSLEDLH